MCWWRTYFLLNPSKECWFFSFVWVGNKLGTQTANFVSLCSSTNVGSYHPCLANFCSLPHTDVWFRVLLHSWLQIWGSFSLPPSFLGLICSFSRRHGFLEVGYLFLWVRKSADFLWEFSLLCVAPPEAFFQGKLYKNVSLLCYASIQVLSASNIHLLFRTSWYLQLSCFLIQTVLVCTVTWDLKPDTKCFQL